jgi:hypothetical protein
MANLDAIVQQLKRERGQAAKAVQQLDAALSALGGSSSGVSQKRGNRLSAAARARIAAAQRARWAKVRSSGKRSPSQKQNVVPISKKRPTLSAAARKKIAAAQRARWAKVRAAQKKSA